MIFAMVNMVVLYGNRADKGDTGCIDRAKAVMLSMITGVVTFSKECIT